MDFWVGQISEQFFFPEVFMITVFPKILGT